MRRRLNAFLLPLGSVALALGAVAACEDDSGGGSPFSFDAATPPFVEAGPVPVPDAAATPDAAPAVVTLTVVDTGTKPIVGRAVVFGDASGRALTTTTTDAQGRASAEVPAGSQATVVLGTSERPRFLTVLGVAPGDEILAVDRARFFDPVDALARVDSPPPNAPAAAVTYRLRSGDCFLFETSDFPAESNLPSSCVQRQPRAPFLLEARDGTGTAVGFTFAKDVTVPTDGGTVAPPLGPWSTALTQQTVNATNLGDAGARFVSFAEVTGGVRTLLEERFTTPPPDGGAFSATFVGHTGFAEAMQAEVVQTEGLRVGGRSITGVVVREDSRAANGQTTIDFGTRLPAITGSGIDAGSPVRPAVAWTSASPLTAADGVYVEIRWFEPLDGGDRYGAWTFVAPPSTTELVAPALPAGTVGLPSAASSFERARIVAVEASFVDGYATLRRAAAAAAPTDALLDDRGGAYAPALPANGTLRYSAHTVTGD